MTSVTILSKDVPDIEVSIYLISLRYIHIFKTYFNYKYTFSLRIFYI